MGAIHYKEKLADVYCVHQTDGSIIPIKIRIEDEDGQRQSYLVRGYRQVDFDGNSVLPSGMDVGSNSNLNFECKIVVFDTEKIIKLLYRKYDGKWLIRV